MINFLLIFLSFCPILTPQPHEMAWTLNLLNSNEDISELVDNCFMERERIRYVVRYVKIKNELLASDINDYYPNSSLIEYLEQTREVYIEYKDYPKLYEANYLPRYEHCSNMIYLNRKVDTYLRSILPFYNEQYYTVISIIAENDGYYQIWDLIRDSVSGYSVCYKRYAMYKLKKLLGVKNLNEFYIQTAYPMHRFQTQPNLGK